MLILTGYIYVSFIILTLIMDSLVITVIGCL